MKESVDERRMAYPRETYYMVFGQKKNTCLHTNFNQIPLYLYRGKYKLLLEIRETRYIRYIEYNLFIFCARHSDLIYLDT